MKKSNSALLFIVILIAVSLFYKYQEIAFKRPQSVHKWRQSDCASIALNYYQGGMHFFKPETHNLTSNSGTTGKCCTSEIPILYYSVAALYKVFGYHEYIYRIFNLLLFFLGLFFLFRILLFLLKDQFWAIALTLLFFTSPVLIYYGNNFLSNSSALAFSIIGWYFFIRYSFEGKLKWFYISMAVFLLAAAFKVTSLFSLMAITGIYLIELSGFKNLNETKKLFTQPVRQILTIMSIFLIIGLWLLYAHYYDLKNDCTYFSTTTFPIWDLNALQISQVLHNIRMLWLDEYFHISVLLFLVLCFIFILYNFRKANKVLLYSVLFIFAETIVYIILQFWTFEDHDYYVIDIYILPILIIISTFDILRTHYGKIFSSLLFKIIFSLLLIFNIYYAHQKLNNRYEGWMNDFNENRAIYSITSYLRQIGISENDTVISIPDASNASLYLMNQKGWTEYTDARFNKGKPVHYNQDSAGIQHSIDKGAAYLILNGIKNLYSKPYLQSFCTELSGNYKNVLIFKLKNRNSNFSIKKREIQKMVHCSAEIVSSDNQFFVSEADSCTFENGLSRTNEFAHSGEYSSGINAKSPYGMTIKFKDLKDGESFSISVWRKSKENAKAGIIASSNEPNPFYNNAYRIIEKDGNGWEKLLMEFFIPNELKNQELKIYVYNPEPDTVYFDDLEITRYKSVYK